MRLEAGKLYALDGKPYRCELVNWCRARLVPAWRESATITGRDGLERTFEFTPTRGLDVSPNAILSEWE